MADSAEGLVVVEPTIWEEPPPPPQPSSTAMQVVTIASSLARTRLRCGFYRLLSWFYFSQATGPVRRRTRSVPPNSHLVAGDLPRKSLQRRHAKLLPEIWQL